MRIFLVAVSLLCVIDVGFAQGLEIGAADVGGDCAAETDMVVSEGVGEGDIDSHNPQRITYGIMPNPGLRLGEMGRSGDLVPKEARAGHKAGC